MLFNSYSFIIFFVVVLIVSRVMGSWTLRKAFLLLASYLFYASWNPPFIVLLWISTLVDWFAAKGLYRSRGAKMRVFYLLVSLVVNLGMLSYFKYCGFFVENLNAFTELFNIKFHVSAPSIILPVGISFYTFQTLSYTLDVYRGKLRPWHSFLDYALYVTFFPQLVAGPIVRASEFLPQCEKPLKGNSRQIGWGLCLLVTGLFFKVFLADAMCAPLVEKVYDSALPAGFLAGWAGTLAFSVQIFSDFFGYSTCAVGVALCLGFELPDNFRYPYAAIGFSDFWRRWHISLSSWLRDYLYIPLGGNRKGVFRTYINLSVTMLLGGLWHGASWMFVIWGALHGFYLIIERILSGLPFALWPLWRKPLSRLFLSLFTFFLVCITWVFFRAGDIGRAFSICGDMLNPLKLYSLFEAAFSSKKLDLKGTVLLDRTDYLLVLFCTLFLLLLHHVLRNSSLEALFGRMHWFLRSLVIAVMLFLVFICMTGDDRAFIYFQF